MPAKARRRSLASPALRWAARWWMRERESALRAKRPASDGAALARRKTRRGRWRFIMGARIVAAKV